MVGDDNVLEQLAEQDEEEARLERERRQAAKAEAATRRRLEELEEVDEMNNAKFDSVNQEVEAKSKKLKKLWTKYQSAKSEIEVGSFWGVGFACCACLGHAQCVRATVG